MQYVKEKSVIKAVENGVVLGKIDLADGTMYGKSGRVVTTVPTCFSRIKLGVSPWGISPYINIVLHKLFELRSEIGTDKEMYSTFEKMISLYLLPQDIATLYMAKNCNFNKKWMEDFIAVNSCCHRDTADKITYQSCNRYDICRAQAAFEARQLNFVSDEEREMFVKIRQGANTYDIPQNIIREFIKRCVLDGLTIQNQGTGLSYSLDAIMKNWYFIQNEMYGKISFKPNILSEYVKLRKIYEAYKKDKMDVLLGKYNSNTKLLYENNDVFVCLLTTMEQFHNEAEQQHNCLEHCYMELCANGQTYVVAIRKKNAPDVSYITCEINPHTHEIVQYTGKFNRDCDIDEIGQKFQKEYQQYLYTL